MTAGELAGYIEHTLLSPAAVGEDYARLCREAVAHGFHSVCVPTSRVSLAAHLTEDTGVKVCSVVGFPLGHSEGDCKRFEAESAVEQGAQEIDMVVNLGWVREGLMKEVYRELRDVVEAAEERPVKVIVEVGLLEREEIERLARPVWDSGALFLKTATGFGPRETRPGDVAFLRSLMGPSFGIKAAGGIRDRSSALEMIEAGATRLGSSAGPRIVAGE